MPDHPHPQYWPKDQLKVSLEFQSRWQSRLFLPCITKKSSISSSFDSVLFVQNFFYPVGTNAVGTESFFLTVNVDTAMM